MLTNQIGTLPNMNGYFTFLIDHNLVLTAQCRYKGKCLYCQGQLCQFSLLFSASAQSTFNMFISLNRLLSVVRSNQLKNVCSLNSYYSYQLFSMKEYISKRHVCSPQLYLSLFLFPCSLVWFQYQNFKSREALANCVFVPITSSADQTHYIAVVIEKIRNIFSRNHNEFIFQKLTIIGFLSFVVGGLIANLLSAILVYKFVKWDP